ncbi:ABC-2 type transport system permease protein [Anaerotaenia torta]|uniref:ABC transporter permease n=1 Tax=Anaerotaenia torta TaxID=433293 RepID=UPI003D1B9DB2
MKAFLKLTAISMQSHMYYRTSFILNLFTPLVLLGGQYLLWPALYGQQAGGAIGGVAREEMYAYILIAFGLNNLLGWSTENVLAREIRSGSVVSRCIRPVSFLVQAVSEMAGAILLQSLVNLIIVTAGFLCFGKYMAAPRLGSVLLFIPCFILSVLLRIMLVEVFSLLCFFSTGHLGITWTRIALYEFFSGAMLPVAMFPVWLKNFTYMTPFPYMLQIPVGLLLGQELPVSLPMIYLGQLAWLAAFILLHSLIYSRVRKNLMIAGG